MHSKKAEESAISLESVHQGELFVETGGTWRGRRILLVEDQDDNRQIVRDLLTATDCEIVEARDGKEAIAAALEEPPDLILMDIQLPIMSGYDATRCIKANPALRRIPIIAVTSYALSGEDATPAQQAAMTLWRSRIVLVTCWPKFVLFCLRHKAASGPAPRKADCN